MRATSLRSSCVGALGLAIALCAAGAAPAQDSLFLDEAVAGAVAQAKAARDLTGWGVASRGSCLFAGSVATKGNLKITLPVYAGKAYLFVAAGDSDVADLDLNVASRDGAIDENDVEDDATPWVFIAPEEDTKVGITIHLYEALNEAEYALTALLVLESGSADGSLARLSKTVSGLTEAIRETRGAVHEATEGKLELILDNMPGSWCLIGGLFSDDERQTLIRSFEGDTGYMTVGWADENARDLDILLSAKENRDEVLAQDVDEDTTPVVDFTCEGESRSLAVTLHMYGAKRPAFGAAAVLVGLPKE